MAETRAIGAFERNLSWWVAGCIVAGILAGQVFPAFFTFAGGVKVAEVNLPVAVLVWLMIVPMLLKIDFGALTEVGRHCERHRRDARHQLGGEAVFDGASGLDLHASRVRAAGCRRTRSIPTSPG